MQRWGPSSRPRCVHTPEGFVLNKLPSVEGAERVSEGLVGGQVGPDACCGGACMAATCVLLLSGGVWFWCLCPGGAGTPRQGFGWCLWSGTSAGDSRRWVPSSLGRLVGFGPLAPLGNPRLREWVSVSSGINAGHWSTTSLPRLAQTGRAPCFLPRGGRCASQVMQLPMSQGSPVISLARTPCAPPWACADRYRVLEQGVAPSRGSEKNLAWLGSLNGIFLCVHRTHWEVNLRV